jgi:hypothetical protein
MTLLQLAIDILMPLIAVVGWLRLGPFAPRAGPSDVARSRPRRRSTLEAMEWADSGRAPNRPAALEAR